MYNAHLKQGRVGHKEAHLATVCGNRCKPASEYSGWGRRPIQSWRALSRPHPIVSRRYLATSGPVVVSPEVEIENMSKTLDSMKWSEAGLVAVIVQHVDTGELLMQAYADRSAVCETLQTRLATFYSRSRKERWCKGETSGNFIKVAGVYLDCDRDSVVYLGEPVGPACHTGARTCWFSEVSLPTNTEVEVKGDCQSSENVPHSTLYALESTIQQRRAAMESGSDRASWTSRLLSDNKLLCKKVREEADELCRTLEQHEGAERGAEEMADLLYHSLVLLNQQGVKAEDVMRVLRGRFGTSGIEEKASRASN
eukprot:evm.model.scf_1970.1 EVM.evm.TU.scf_1970.1   scf_1970:10381-13878(+)